MTVDDVGIEYTGLEVAVFMAPQRDPVARCTRRGRSQSSATLCAARSRMTDKASDLFKTTRLRPEPIGKDLGARE